MMRDTYVIALGVVLIALRAVIGDELGDDIDDGRRSRGSMSGLGGVNRAGDDDGDHNSSCEEEGGELGGQS